MEEIFTERLDEILMRRGFSTNRKVRRLVQTHELCVNGKRVLIPGTRVSLRYDTITLDGKPMELKPDVYLIMNKPQGCLCTNFQEGHKTVFDYINSEYKKRTDTGPLHTAGRLDGNTEGLLLLTTNGDFSHSLVIPETHVNKTYFIGLSSPVEDLEQQLWIEKCKLGLQLPETHSGPAFFTKPAELDWNMAAQFNEYNRFGPGLCCCLTITEGKFHQVKRMIKALGNEVAYLKRVSMGQLLLPCDLEPGCYREMTDKELLLISTKL